MERPPLGVRARYVFGLRVPPEWIGWAERDLSTTGWLRRRMARSLILILAVWGSLKIVQAVLGDLDLGDAVFGLVFVGVFAIELAVAPRLERTARFERQRGRLLAYQRGEPASAFWGGTDDRGGPFILWVIGALAIAAITSVLVAALT